MKKKRIAWPLILSIATLLVILSYLGFITQKEKIELVVKEAFIKKVEDKLSSKVEVGKIDIFFNNTMILNKIIINNGSNDLIKIKKVVLKYSLWDFLIKKNKNLLVSKIKLYSPSLSLIKGKNNKWNWEKLFKLKRANLVECPKIEIKDGVIHLVDFSCDLNLFFKQVNFLINPKIFPSPFSIKGILKERKKGTFHLFGTIDKYSPLLANFKLSFEDLELEKFRYLLKRYVEEIKEGQVKGEIIGSLNEIKKKRYQLTYQGRWRLEKGKVKFYLLKNLIKDISLEGNFKKDLDQGNHQFFPAQISLNLKKALYQNISFYGFIESSLAFIKVSLVSPKMNLNKWINLKENSFFFRKISDLEGDLNIETTYDKKEDFWQGEVVCKNLIANYDKKEDFRQGEVVCKKLIAKKEKSRALPSLMAKFKYQGNKVNLFDLSWGKDVSFTGEGEINLQKELNFKANLQFEKMPLLNLLEIFEIPHLDLFTSSDLTGNVALSGNPKEINYRSLLKVANKSKNKDLFNYVNIALNGKGKELSGELLIQQEEGYLRLKSALKKNEKGDLFKIDGDLSLNNFNILNQLINSEITLYSQREKEDIFLGELKVKRLVCNNNDLGDFNYCLYYQGSTLETIPTSSRIGLLIKNKIQFNQDENFLNSQISLNNLDFSLITNSFKELKRYQPLQAFLFGEMKLCKKPKEPLLITAKNLKLKNTSVNKDKLGDFNLDFSYFNQSLQISRLTEEREKIDLTGKIKLKDFKATEAQLILKTNLVSTYYGHLTSTLHINQRDSLMIISGDADLGLKEGRLGFQNIVAEIEKDKYGQIEITKFVSNLNKVGHLSLIGKIKSQKQDLDLYFQIKELPISTLPSYILARNSGSLNLSGYIKGKIRQPEVSLNFQTNSLKINKRIPRDFEGEVTLAEDKMLRFKSSSSSKSIFLEGTIDFKKDLEVDASLFFNQEVAKDILDIFTPLKNVEGTVSGQILIKEKLINPKLIACLKVNELAFLKVKAKEAEVKFCYFNREIKIEQLFLDQKSGFLNLNESVISLYPEGRFQIKVNLTNFKFLGLSLAGKVELFTKSKPDQGDDKYEGLVKATNLVFNKRVKVKEIYSQFLYQDDTLYLSPYQEERSILGEMIFSFPDRITINKLDYVKGNQLFLRAQGVVFPKEERLNIDLEAFEPLLKMVPEYLKNINSVSGKLEAKITIEGLFNNYRLLGRLVLTQGEVTTSLKYFEKLTKVEAKVDLDDYYLKIRDLSFSLNKGIVNSYGEIVIPEKKINLCLTTTKPLELSIPLEIEAKLLANLHLEGDYETLVCKGIVEFLDTNFTYRKKLSRKKEYFFNQVKFDLKLLAKNNVRYYNNYVKCKVIDSSWIRFLGFPGRFEVTGDLKSSSGYIEYLGTRFSINKAELEFREGENSPYLSGEAQTKIDDILILLSYQGKLFESEPLLCAPGIYPPKTKDEIVGMLRLGRDYKKVGKEKIDALLFLGLIRLTGIGLNDSLIKPLESNLSKLLKVDVDISLPYVERYLLKEEEKDLKKSADKSPETMFNLGKYITDDLYLNYRGAMGRKKEESKFLQEFGLEYHLRPEESIKYEYLPKSNGEKEEHEISIKKEISF